MHSYNINNSSHEERRGRRGTMLHARLWPFTFLRQNSGQTRPRTKPSKGICTSRLSPLSSRLSAFALLLLPLAASAQGASDAYERFRFGSYAEMVANFKNYDSNRFAGQPSGADHGHFNSISVPRFTLAFDYKFTPKWQLGSEIEFESGGVGLEQELEASENGEYETEMEHGGEVALEQLHITRVVCPEFNVRVGHMVVPVGLINAHHEPIFFYGSERPEGETTIIPSTWHETGASCFGSVSLRRARLDYQAMVIAGLNPDGFGRDNWVAGGKQGLFEKDNFSCPAYAARLDFSGTAGHSAGGSASASRFGGRWRAAVSAYFCPDPARNSDKSNKYARYTAEGRNTLALLSADGEYAGRYFTLRGGVLRGTLAHSDVVSSVTMSNKSGYQSGIRRQVAHSALTYSGEAGIDLRAVIGSRRCPALHPFVHYEYFNPQQTAEGSRAVDARCQVSKWQAGLNWRPLPNLVVKADYSNRRIGTQRVFGYDGTYHRENEFSLGVAYIGWFVKR